VPVVTDLPRAQARQQSGSGMVVATPWRRPPLDRSSVPASGLQADRGRWWLKDLPDGQGIGYDRFANVVGSLLGG
jgi:hypothetical protein